MTSTDSKFEWLYTTVAVMITGSAYVFLSVVIIRPLMTMGETVATATYTIGGVLAICCVHMVRQQLRRTVEHINRGRGLTIAALEHEIAAVFMSQEQMYTTCNELASVLRIHLECNDARVILRIRGRYCTIHHDSETQLSDDNPMVEYMKNQPSLSKVLYRNSAAFRTAPSEVQEYWERHEIVCAIPLILEKRLFGWISIHDKRPSYRLTEDDRRFLISVQPLLSVGLRRVGIDRALNRRIEELIALQKISHTINSSLNVKETLESVMDAIVELLHVDRALLYLRLTAHDRVLSLAIGRGLTEDVDINHVLQLSTPIVKEVLEQRESAVVENVFTDPRVTHEFAAMLKTRSCIFVPLVAKERSVGVIVVDNRFTNRPLSEVNLDLLITMANQAAIALVNSRLYERTQRFNAELQQRIKLATAHLQQLLEMRSHFLTIASHQLRTPTTIVRGMLSLLIEDPDMTVQDQRSLMNKAFTSAGRLERIISELLSATALEDPTAQLVMEQVSVVEIVSAIHEQLQPLAIDRGTTLVLVLPSSQYQPVDADRFKLQEAVTNVVDNAIRYTPKGRVTVRVEQDPMNVTIHIQDTGVGLTEEDKKIIFDKFQRGVNIKEVEPNGTGLGLFITKRIIDLHGGSIHVDSDGRNKGTTFTLTIPVHYQGAIEPKTSAEDSDDHYNEED